LHGLIVIDEFQRNTRLFPILRVLAERSGFHARFLILGSASPELIKGASESLAGRIYFIDRGGLACTVVGVETRNRLWFRSGFLESYLARDDKVRGQWRRSFIQTFLRQDVPGLGLNVPPDKLYRFWMIAAYYHGQTWNSSGIAASLSISHPTARYYLDVLTGGFVMRPLQPWLPNLKKRLFKSPKVYLRDSGLRHSLLQIDDMHSLQGNPRYGASWEGFGLEQICEVLEVDPEDAFLLGNTCWGREFGMCDGDGSVQEQAALPDLFVSGIQDEMGAGTQ